VNLAGCSDCSGIESYLEEPTERWIVEVDDRLVADERRPDP
jgi:hypothetical protein